MIFTMNNVAEPSSPTPALTPALKPTPTPTTSLMPSSAAALRHALQELQAGAPWAPADRPDPSANGLTIEWVDATASTNADLLQAPFGAQPAAPRVRLADAQRAGRGRRGRGWTMVAGASVALSVAVERASSAAAIDRPNGPGSWSGLSLAVGVCLAQRLASLGAPVLLKWPNDLIVDDRKAGGILIELRRQSAMGLAGIERAVIGIGLNRWPHPLLAQVDPPAGALFGAPRGLDRSAGGGAAACSDAVTVAAAAVAAVFDALVGLERGGLDCFADDWRRLDWLAGRELTILEADGTQWTGVAGGIDPSGALRIVVGGRIRLVVAADVSVRLAAACPQ